MPPCAFLLPRYPPLPTLSATAVAVVVAAVTASACRGGGGGGEGDWGCVGRCELCGTVIKASFRRKCRTIYRKVRRSIITTLMNGGTHALLIATSYYAYSVPFMTNS
ncbi:hypothetical protein ALC60_04583 [Trachymyrmex zeteki]|uniref:Uncharacterized protein n=1 Tax=Mycetomoellerius zeteki TaxID=64791 RepID=A0A151X802_9HYME|nr:hypothetical protein ALC60_04583 [Trachymyrmex zeteki]